MAFMIPPKRNQILVILRAPKNEAFRLRSFAVREVTRHTA